MEGTAGHMILEWGGRCDNTKQRTLKVRHGSLNQMLWSKVTKVIFTKINLVAENVVDSRQGEQLG